MHYALYCAVIGQAFTFISGFTVSLVGPSFYPDHPWLVRIITSIFMLIGIIGMIGVIHVL